VRFRFVASDEEPGGIVEAALDDFAIVTYQSAMTAVLPDPSALPRALDLEQNFPNPFNSETAIHFSVSAPGAIVSLRIYDVAGRLVAKLLDDEKVIGTRVVRWNGQDRNGEDVASGVYFYRLITPDKTLSRKLVVIR
jgi:hypothetical protein